METLFFVSLFKVGIKTSCFTDPVGTACSPGKSKTFKNFLLGIIQHRAVSELAQTRLFKIPKLVIWIVSM